MSDTFSPAELVTLKHALATASAKYATWEAEARSMVAFRTVQGHDLGEFGPDLIRSWVSARADADAVRERIERMIGAGKREGGR